MGRKGAESLISGPADKLPPPRKIISYFCPKHTEKLVPPIGNLIAKKSPSSEISAPVHKQWTFPSPKGTTSYFEGHVYVSCKFCSLFCSVNGSFSRARQPILRGKLQRIK